MIDLSDHHTIVAIASPTTPAPRGIVRMSGRNVAEVLHAAGINAPARTSRFHCAIDVGDPLGIIDADILYWPNDRCYTGEPSAEIHTYGSVPILTAIVDRMCAAGARPARPGEFTMRAFLAGRMDLVQAEAVLGVIEAENRGALNAALTQLAGNVSTPLEFAREELLNLLADVEAGLDFVDEEIQFISDQDLIHRLESTQSIVQQAITQLQTRGGGQQLPVVVLRGLPNAGKSCLINRISGQDSSIVTPIAGTTRDSVTIVANLQSSSSLPALPVLLVDTAGIEEDRDELTMAMSRQSQQQDSRSHIRVWCIDSTASDFQHQASHLRRVANSTRRSGTRDLWVATKTDLKPTKDLPSGDWIGCSGLTGQGIPELVLRIETEVLSRDQEQTGSIIGTAARCQDSLESASSAISAALQATHEGIGHEIVSTEMRIAAQAIGEVTGAVYTDDILDRVFSRFCIGK
jgi:tRNA modification GTPase